MTPASSTHQIPAPQFGGQDRAAGPGPDPKDDEFKDQEIPF